jgi:hypothetical protein
MDAIVMAILLTILRPFAPDARRTIVEVGTILRPLIGSIHLGIHLGIDKPGPCS